MIAFDILKVMVQWRPKDPSGLWVLIPELSFTTGYESQRRIDLWMMQEHPSKLFLKYSFEVKVSKSDFSRDLADPMKHRLARAYSNYFYFVAPAGLLDQKKIPPWAGLWEIHESPEGLYMASSPIVPCMFSDSEQPGWGLLVKMARFAGGATKEQLDISTKEVAKLRKDVVRIRGDLWDAERKIDLLTPDPSKKDGEG